MSSVTDVLSQAIDHAVEEWDVDIISMSFGLRPPSLEDDMPEWRRIKGEIQEKIDSAKRRLFFAAAENEGKNERCAFPATHDDVFCIHASDGLGNDAGINPPIGDTQNNFMTLGVGLEFLEGHNSDRVIKDGTSFATAIAAGMAASILDLTSRTAELKEWSKRALRTPRGMRMLFREMSGSDRGEPRPYVAPWNYWQRDYWTNNPDGLGKTWAGLNALFNDFP